MGPLPVGNRSRESCAGHINPVSVFYLVHALAELGFTGMAITVDRYQRSGLGKLILWWLPIRLMAAWIGLREARKYRTIDDSNRALVQSLNGLPILLGRTIVVTARKG
ncbi:MAG: hypothetical protein AB1634_13725 [Thermodesulfobacteriota bacterium]